MAVLAVAVAGAAAGGVAASAAGFAFGTAAFATAVGIGWSVGSVIGGYVFGPKPPGPQNQHIEGPRLETLVSRGGSYGVDFPESWGRARIGTVVIWKLPLREEARTSTTVTESDGGGKGGKGGSGTAITQTTTSYFYYGTWAVAVIGRQAEVARIWFNSVLLHNHRNPNSRYADHITVYEGTEEQLPDPTMEANEGSGNVPGYRGIVYIVFNDIPLQEFGYSIPNVEVEMIRRPNSFCEASGATLVSSSAPPAGRQYWGWTANPNDPDGILDSRLYYSGGQAILEGGSTYRYTAGRLTFDENHVVKGTLESQEYYTADYGASPQAPSYVFEGVFYAVWDQNHFYDAQYNKFAIDTANLPDLDHAPISYNKFVYAATTGDLLTEDGFAYASDNTVSGFFEINLSVLTRDASNIATGYAISRTFTIPSQVGTFLNLVRGTDGRWWLVWSNALSSTSFTLQHVTFNLINDEVEVEDTWVITASAAVSWDEIVLHEKCVMFNDTQYGLMTRELSAGGVVGPLVAMYGDGAGAHHINTSYVRTTRSSGDVAFLEGVFDAVLNNVPFAEIIEDLAEDSGLQQSELDTSLLTGRYLHGFIRTGTMSARSAIAPLQTVFPFDIIESSGVLRFQPVTDPSSETGLVLTDDDVAVREHGAQSPQDLVLRRVQETDTPREIRMSYADLNLDYDVGMHRAFNPVSPSEARMDISLPLVTDAATAKSICQRFMDAMQTERTAVSFSLGLEYLALEPGDIVTLNLVRGIYLVRLTRVDISPLNILQCEGVLYLADAYTQLSNADEGVAPLPIQIPVEISSEFFDLPVMFSGHTEYTGFYAIAYPKELGAVFNGADVYHQRGAGWWLANFWNETQEPTFGSVSSPAGSVTRPFHWDDINTITVTLEGNQTTLSSSTDLDVQNGANFAAVGIDGRWEIISFVNATHVGGNSWQLSRLLRGRRGTERFIGTGQAGDRFLLYDYVGPERVTLSDLGLIGQEQIYRVVPEYERVEFMEDVPYTFNGVCNLPLAPVRLEGHRVAGDLRLHWTRRVREAVVPRMGVEYGGFHTEDYYLTLRLSAGGAILRTLIVRDATTTTYTLDSFRADSGQSGATQIPPLHITLVQDSLIPTVGFSPECAATI